MDVYRLIDQTLNNQIISSCTNRFQVYTILYIFLELLRSLKKSYLFEQSFYSLVGAVLYVLNVKLDFIELKS